MTDDGRLLHMAEDNTNASANRTYRHVILGFWDSTLLDKNNISMVIIIYWGMGWSIIVGLLLLHMNLCKWSVEANTGTAFQQQQQWQQQHGI